jgi:hypothetical protein
MLKIGTTTKLTATQAIEKAVAFFGPGGYKLTVKDRKDDYVMFEGGGGGIEISACDSDKGTSVDIITREWEYQVKEFIGTIK